MGKIRSIRGKNPGRPVSSQSRRHRRTSYSQADAPAALAAEAAFEEDDITVVAAEAEAAKDLADAAADPSKAAAERADLNAAEADPSSPADAPDPSTTKWKKQARAADSSMAVLCWMLCQPSVGCSLWATPDLNIKETLLHTELYRTPGTSILTKAILYTKNKFIAEIILKNGILKLEKLSGQVKEQHQRNHRVEFGCPSQSALWKSDVLRRPGLDKRWNVPICYSNPAIRIGHQRILL